jgi:hypothetical protein
MFVLRNRQGVPSQLIEQVHPNPLRDGYAELSIAMSWTTGKCESAVAGAEAGPLSCAQRPCRQWFISIPTPPIPSSAIKMT